jgi:hypothetical protein
MPEKKTAMLDKVPGWICTAMLTLILFAGKSTIRDVVREEIGELQRTVRRLELQVATLEANAGLRERAQDKRFNNNCDE